MNNGVYQGEFQSGTRHGKGRYEWNSSGDIYDGEWNTSVKNGFGKLFTAKENQWYEGMFKNGMKHGQGRVLMKDGVTQIHKGTWHNDKKL